MKKVGLMTCYLNNLGACLQAYALQKVVIGLGHKCEIISYSPNNEVTLPHSIKNKVKACYRFLRGIYDKHYSFEAARITKFNRFRKEYLLFSKHKFLSVDDLYKYDFNYDCFVVGSDQLWNPIIHKGNNKAYFLNFVKNDRTKIAYAPSIGLTEIPYSYKEEMANLLLSFDYLSAREKTGCNIVENLTSRKCRLVLDPTLLIDREGWNKLVKNKHTDEKYVFCYLFGDRPYIQKFVNYIKKKTGLRVICIPYNDRELYSPFYKIKYAGPKEFLYYIKNASLIITDSFHATAFALNFNVPFYTLLRNELTEECNMNSRVIDILSFVNLEERLIKSEDDFPNEINMKIDFTNANRIIEDKRRDDINFLKECIG